MILLLLLAIYLRLLHIHFYNTAFRLGGVLRGFALEVFNENKLIVDVAKLKIMFRQLHTVAVIVVGLIQNVHERLSNYVFIEPIT